MAGPVQPSSGTPSVPHRISIEFTGKSVTALPPQNRAYLKTFGFWSLINNIGTYLGWGGDINTLRERVTAAQTTLIEDLENSILFLDSEEKDCLGKIITFFNANLLQPVEGQLLTKGDCEWNMLVFAKANGALLPLKMKAVIHSKCSHKWNEYKWAKLKIQKAMVEKTKNFSPDQKKHFNSLSFKDQLLYFLESNKDLSKNVLDMLDEIEHQELHSTDTALGNETYQKGTQVMKAALNGIGMMTFASRTEARRNPKP